MTVIHIVLVVCIQYDQIQFQFSGFLSYIKLIYHLEWNVSRFKLGLGVLICLDMVSIETLDLDTGREPVSTVEIF